MPDAPPSLAEMIEAVEIEVANVKADAEQPPRLGEKYLRRHKLIHAARLEAAASVLRDYETVIEAWNRGGESETARVLHVLAHRLAERTIPKNDES